jgi:hypothetical protein
MVRELSKHQALELQVRSAPGWLKALATLPEYLAG